MSTKVKVKPKYNLSENKEDIKKIDYTFENVIKINEKEYSVMLSAWDIAELWDKDILTYFSPIQRGLKQKRTSKGKTIDVPIVSEKNINEMADLILNGKFFTSQLTINVLEYGENHIEYNEDDRTATVNCQITLLDGMHRVSSLYKAWQKAKIINEDELINRLKNLMFPIKITNYPEVVAKSCFSQYSLGLKLNKSKTESFDMSKSSNRIVDKLNNGGALKGLIDTTKTSITNGNQQYLYTFATLNEAIKNAFGIIQNEKEEEDILDFLKLFFNELFKIFPELGDEELRRDSKEYSFICENIMSYGYMTLASELFLRRLRGWQEELSVISKIDFDKASEIWQPIVRINDDKISIVNNKNTRSILSKILKQEFYKAQY